MAGSWRRAAAVCACVLAVVAMHAGVVRAQCEDELDALEQASNLFTVVPSTSPTPAQAAKYKALIPTNGALTRNSEAARKIAEDRRVQAETASQAYMACLADVRSSQKFQMCNNKLTCDGSFEKTTAKPTSYYYIYSVGASASQGIYKIGYTKLADVRARIRQSVKVSQKFIYFGAVECRATCECQMDNIFFAAMGSTNVKPPPVQICSGNSEFFQITGTPTQQLNKMLVLFQNAGLQCSVVPYSGTQEGGGCPR